MHICGLISLANHDYLRYTILIDKSNLKYPETYATGNTGSFSRIKIRK